MAYRCGYVNGYEDLCVIEPSPACATGFAGTQYAASTYGGAVPCVGYTPTTSVDIQSNVEEYCILDNRC